MKNRFHFYLIGGILLIGLIFGSFFDLEIEQALFNDRNGFSITLACLGPLPGYSSLGFLCGVLFGIMLVRKTNLAHRIAYMIASIGGTAYGIYRQMIEFTGFNGMNLPDYRWLGFIVAFIIIAGLFVIGVFLGRKNQRDNMWIILSIMAAIIICSIFGGYNLLKIIFHRPRYRILVSENFVEFTPWWQRFSNYKDYIGLTSLKGYVITSEEFKSFPSGHSCGAAMMMMVLSYLPFLFPKLKKHQTLLFYVGAIWMFVVMFSRICAGAHYLSDTCFGSLLLVIFFYIGNEVVVKKVIKE